ncbi:MAG: hypothetical protein DRJ10_14565 [Bacteroidetes bacterium]|nr:MAG: hypothetical protein DRJ10_14565 [Bacteroidota bacterium]RLD86685.1 MAG: hypothetical protein DRJ07_00195 [Bacteroidota bacterium]
MKKYFIYLTTVVFFGAVLTMSSCNNDDDDTPIDPGESATELLVKKFDAAPSMDGEIDDIWGTAQRLTTSAQVPSGLGNRMTYYNAVDLGEETLDIFEAYEGETENFTMRSGYVGSDIYFLIEWADAVDSKDRQSWYFDSSSQRWRGEHKYANKADDKFYEDKFSFLFPIGEVDNFAASTCYATCHTVSSINNTKDKHTRHYLKGSGQKVDMWHWKRVRGTHNDRIDDQRMTYKEGPYTSSTNGRSGDEDGQSGYSNNSQTLMMTGTEVEVNVPLYVVFNGTDYYWIPEAQLDNEAKKVIAVALNGTLTLDGGETINPNDGGYEQGVGAKRIPSILTRDFTGGRADLEIKAVHTGTGWVCEVKRKLNTGDVDDVVFDVTKEFPFGFAIFNNAAIAHAIKPGLLMKFEQ